MDSSLSTLASASHQPSPSRIEPVEVSLSVISHSTRPTPLGGIGKNTNLRGYRKTRFYGDYSFYNNAELRFTLFGFRTYLFPSKVGLLLFHDIGRVWAEGEDSNKWHQGIGTGLWLTPFESMVLSLSLAFGEEENIINFRFGFLF